MRSGKITTVLCYKHVHMDYCMIVSYCPEYVVSCCMMLQLLRLVVCYCLFVRLCVYVLVVDVCHRLPVVDSF